jgi:protein-disulfide isomerase
MSGKRIEQRRRGQRRKASSGPRTAAPRLEYLLGLALGIAGLIVSALLVRLHAQAHAGASSFCSLSETVNCDRVALSAHSVQLGIPVAAWGMLGYAVTAAVAAAGLVLRRTIPTWPAAALLVLGAVATAASVGFALVSKLLIGAWCLLCVVSWAISLGLLVAGWRACRVGGARSAIHSAFVEARDKPFRVASVLAVLAVATGLVIAMYPRYWEQPRSKASAAVPSPSPGGKVAERPNSAAAGPLIVVEYTDFECPYCARMHDDLRTVSRRPDVRIVRRHFPLDGACNPAVRPSIHPSACRLARAAICAEDQGMASAMEDELFGNQRDKLPVETLAARVKLDLQRFEACLASNETGRRLAADIAAAQQDGVRATPSYVVGGTVYPGRFPVELLPSGGPVQSR